MTTDPLAALQAHRELCRAFLALLEQEAVCLCRDDLAGLPEVDAARRELLPRLTEVTARLKEHRLTLDLQPDGQRALPPEARLLAQENQEWLLRALALDRENERARLRHGLVPPRHLPPPPPPGPGYVAEKYRRQGLG